MDCIPGTWIEGGTGHVMSGMQRLYNRYNRRDKATRDFFCEDTHSQNHRLHHMLPEPSEMIYDLRKINR